MGKEIIGVIPPVITPLDEEERVDEKAFRRLISHCIEHGIHGIFVAGSNGECMALTQKERDRAIKIALDETAGRVPVIAGVMDSSTKRVIENIKRLEQMGGKVAVVTPVFYARHVCQEETVRHFETIADHTDMDLMIYNIPVYTGQTLYAETIFKIAEIDKVIGYKDTSGLLPEFVKCLRKFKGTDFVLHQGSTNLAAPSLLMGADGYIPSLAPLYPREHIALYEAAKRKDLKETEKWGEAVDRICKVYSMAKNPVSATKYAISRLGFLHGRSALPTEPVTEEEARRIDCYLDTLDKALYELI